MTMGIRPTTPSGQNLHRILDGLAAISGIPIIFTDTEGNSLTATPPGERQWEEKSGPLPSREVPVLFGEEKVGSISCRGVGEQLDPLLKMAAFSMENAFRLEAELEDLSSEIVRLYQELSLIYSLSHKLGSALDINTICAQALEEIGSAIEVNSIIILLLDDRSGMLNVQSCIGPAGEAIRGMRFDAGADPFSDILARKKVATVKKLPKELPLLPGSSLCVPLVTDDKNIGILIASNKKSGEEFRSQEIKLMDALSGEIAAAIKKAQLYERIQKLFINTVEALASAIDAKDPYTYGHSRRVAKISAAICEEIGMPREKILPIELAALLHDIGKIGTPEHILQKPGKLKPEEMEIIKEHPLQGAQILSNIEELKEVMDWIKHHHECYDGKGYPDMSRAEDIPLPSRIISIADSFDAMTSDRPYRKGMDPAKVMDIMDDFAGTQYDPGLLQTFKCILRSRGADFANQDPGPTAGKEATSAPCENQT